MKEIHLIFFLLLVADLTTHVVGGNPFYVDKSSVQKDTYKWTMKLKNRDATSEDTSNKQIRDAAVTIESLDKSVLHLKIIDANEKRWEAPLLNKESGKKYTKRAMDSMGFKYFDEPFGFSITDPDYNELVAEMSPSRGGSMQFQDKYLEMGLYYQSKRIFGLGERTTGDFELCTERDQCIYTLWGKDVASPYDDGGGGGKGAYGQQPFYLIHFSNSKRFMGVLSFNSNDQDALINKHRDGTANVIHKMIGGVFDFYFFYPGTAEFVLKKYHEFIGRPMIPPFWSLGFHQCRYGWRTLNKVKEVVMKFEQTDIPLEVVWGDIDYMKDYADFTVDPVRFGGMGDFVKELHRKKMRWVPIIDAGLKYDVNDKYYKMGEEHGAFIKSAFTKKTLIGRVWPGLAVFLSWYNPWAKKVWLEGLKDLHEQAEFDGIWLDMNEIANFCHGECPPKGEDEEEPTRTNLRRTLSADPHDPHEFDNLPYRPGNQDITDKTVSMTGYHTSTNEYEDRVLKEYNLHSLWALFEAKATHEYFEEKLQRRPFILTRANFPGSGMYTTKWLGDNHARWEYMRYSIIGIYNFQLFGMPFTGSDMCGFMGDSNEELCGRWMQMGAFYPFSRNHNDIHSRDQEPYVFGERVAAASRNAIRQKYSILWYYYTKLYEVSLYGGSMVRPLFFEFPDDQKAYEKTKYMFMIGPSILIPPVLFERNDKTYPYCPNENWFNLKTFSQVYSYKPGRKEGEQITLSAGFDYVNVLLKGGSIIPYQDAVNSKVRRTEVLKVLPLNMLIAPDHNGKAEGSLIVDGLETLHPIENKAYRHLTFKFDMSQKRLEVKKLNDFSMSPYKFEAFTKMTLFAAKNWAGMRNACIHCEGGKKVGINASYDSQKELLHFTKSNSGVNWKDISSIVFDESCQNKLH